MLERHRNAETSLSYGVGVATLGSALKLFSYLYAAEDGLFGWYCIGHLMICFAIAQTTTISIFVTKYLYRDMYALVDVFSSIPLALVISFIMTFSVYRDNDRFFTNSEWALYKNFWVMVSQAIVFFVLGVYNIFRRMVLNDD